MLKWIRFIYRNGFDADGFMLIACFYLLATPKVFKVDGINRMFTLSG